jgi:hypothetical protein
MSITSTAMPRRWGRIPAAVTHSGLGRSKLYELAAQHEGLFKKYNTVTIVDFERLDQILAGLPAAKINLGTKETAQTKAGRPCRACPAFSVPVTSKVRGTVE